jgi:hypothetical protein
MTGRIMRRAQWIAAAIVSGKVMEALVLEQVVKMVVELEVFPKEAA